VGKTVITFIRSASIAPGKTGDEIAFANQIGKHIKENYGTTVELLVPVGGNPNRIAWHAHYESLAQLEALAAKLLADTEYMGIIAKNSATFLPGSVHDEIWRTI
jgi:L-ascorbate metabolism protein UlaG (beta-lactamase superfamily)